MVNDTSQDKYIDSDYTSKRKKRVKIIFSGIVLLIVALVILAVYLYAQSAKRARILEEEMSIVESIKMETKRKQIDEAAARASQSRDTLTPAEVQVKQKRIEEIRKRFEMDKATSSSR